MKDLTNIAKPCPMCGSKRIYILYPKVDFIYSVMSIKCADCGLTGYKNVTNDVSIEDVMERTINYWNTRAESEG
jgi:hypothetical protein